MKKLLVAAILSLGMVFTPLIAQTALAIDLFPGNVCSGADCSAVKASDTELANRVQNIINIALMIAGAVAVIMVVIGGLRMISANGRPGDLESGRMTVIWAVVGIIVVILSSAIVNFVVDWNW